MNVCCIASHPEWVRGLKHGIVNLNIILIKSHPEWVRGLKRPSSTQLYWGLRVAPRVGAWIETEMEIGAEEPPR